jgi:hypothetical protein
MGLSFLRFSVACGVVLLGLAPPRRAAACAYPGCVVGRYIPAAAHATGVNGALWITDLNIVNTGTEPVTVYYDFLTSREGGSPGDLFSVTLAPLQSTVIPDVVGTTFGTDGAGGIGLSTVAGSGHFLAEARTYDASRPELGTHGFAASDVGSESAFFDSFLLVSNAPGPHGVRTNVGFLNALAAPARVDLTLLDGDGTTLGATTVFTAGRFWQVNDVFTAMGAGEATVKHGVVRVHAQTWTVDTPPLPLPVIGYATVIDNQSQDPTFAIARPDRADVPPPP